jgi:hypothetical protein
MTKRDQGGLPPWEPAKQPGLYRQNFHGGAVMSSSTDPSEFAPTYHAMLFAWLCRAVVRKAGQERGQRMALRAQANGHALNMANYLAYSEWRAGKGEMRQKIVTRTPDAVVHVVDCPWCKAWHANRVIRCGRLYCLEVDRAVLQGFNPQLRLYLNWCLAYGDGQCELVFRDAHLTLPTLLSLAYKMAVKPGKAASLPWELHLGHLYSTVQKVVVEDLGQTGQEAVCAGLDEFANHYGDDAAHKIQAYQQAGYNWSSLSLAIL